MMKLSLLRQLSSNLKKVTCLTLLISTTLGFSQSIPLGYPGLDDYLRRSQLLGKVDSSLSFMVRPLQSNLLRSTLKDSLENYLYKQIGTGSKVRKLSLLPLQVRTEFNSHYPYGWNNGSMLRSRGVQTLLSGGLHYKIGLLSVQLKPEFVFVQNQDFDGFPDSHSNFVWRTRYNRTWNRIDLPEKFGQSPLWRVLPGQSSIRVNHGAFSLGISTENIWWGPGRNHSLIMTNNAAGFTHLTLNTKKPARTSIGSFEGQFIVARLENSGIDPPIPQREITNSWLIPKHDEWRYLNGITITYQPRWVPGLFLGTSRVFQDYNDSTRIKKNYLPVFSNLWRVNDPNTSTDGSLDQLWSVFARWVLVEAQAEFYFEVGRADATWNFRDLLLSPDHSAGYIFGFSKLINLSNQNQHLEISMETIHLELAKTGTLRLEPTWYQNGRNRHGYTHRGEVLGSGIGPGSNSQFLSVSWIKDFRKVGFLAERLINDNDFYYHTFGLEEPMRNWVNLSLGVFGSWNTRRLLIEGKLQLVTSRNYQWELTENRTNFYSQINVLYHFK